MKEKHIKFAVISDPQVGNEIQEYRKRNAVRAVRDYAANYCIFPGDLTENGYNGDAINWIYHNILCCNCGKRQESRQLDEFVRRFVDPLEEAGIKVLAVAGNHDEWTGPILPVHGWIRRKYAGLHYKFAADFLDIYALHVYPGRKELDWLLREYDVTRMSVLVFHYPLAGYYSDDWDNSYKDELYRIIRNGKTVMICTGHAHISDQYEWHGIPVINAAAEHVGFFEVSSATGLENAGFLP